MKKIALLFSPGLDSFLSNWMSMPSEEADIQRLARWCVVFFEGLLFQFAIFVDRERILSDWQIFLRSLFMHTEN